MKKLETVLAVTAAMILALSAAGCSSSSDDDDNETGGAGELVSKELEISETPQLLVKADELKNISSLTISITNIYTSESDWWFGIVDENGENYQEIKWKSGESSECIYELSITDFSTYSNGIYIKGVSSTATVKATAEEGSASQDTPSNTETPSDTDTSSGDGNSGTENGNEDSTGDTEKTITLVFYSYNNPAKYVNIWKHTGIEFANDVTLSTSWNWEHSQGIMTESTEHEKWYKIKLKIKDANNNDEGFDIYKDSSSGNNNDKLFSSNDTKATTVYNNLVNSTSEILYLYYDDTNSKYATSATYPW
ncbi:MAG: hypothetical protein J6K96_07130 [Treponema sp.]|nr:hypothetical protein [Treponema sp.]